MKLKNIHQNEIVKSMKEERKEKEGRKDKESGVKNKNKKGKQNSNKEREKTEGEEFIVIENSFVEIEKPSLKTIE